MGSWPVSTVEEISSEKSTIVTRRPVHSQRQEKANHTERLELERMRINEVKEKHERELQAEREKREQELQADREQCAHNLKMKELELKAKENSHDADREFNDWTAKLPQFKEDDVNSGSEWNDTSHYASAPDEPFDENSSDPSDISDDEESDDINSKVSKNISTLD
ncbi:PH domain-containing protein DDB_G0287875-like [Ptychodera flava]|uniref:PH domain-containing protein DDB_G0287875-like n=1 Tax=Ptychodera flava TaxID=63121 RepID=UPI003969F56E